MDEMIRKKEDGQTEKKTEGKTVVQEQNTKKSRRSAGILLPVSSLPSRYGIGCFSREARQWIDFLEESGQTYWQILPLGPISYGDSPYQSFSTFAGNPLYISLEDLMEKGLLTREECEAAGLENNPSAVDYGRQYDCRYPLLETAYRRSGCRSDEKFQEFCDSQSDWLPDYALFMALKEEHQGASWQEWEPELVKREADALTAAKNRLADRVVYYEYLQYLFRMQWDKLHAYAGAHGIQIIGDIPIYVALDSADVWTHPELFQMDENCRPAAVAGCPPDAFSEDGQLWGNPLYDWPAHKAQNYRWWIGRIRACEKLYDVVRIDHFRGFDSYYAIPYGEKTARNGEWEKGPGMELFSVLKKEMPHLSVIAEDLGFMTDSVRKLVSDTGFPNMKVLQFAFDSDADNEYLPHWYTENSVVYTGTHDNETLMQHLENMSGHERWHMEEYLNIHNETNEQLSDAVIRAALGSVSSYCIIPMQDWLQIGRQGRINTPSTLGGNWTWRMNISVFDNHKLAEKIRYLTRLFAR